MWEIRGKQVLVTGATTGIGREIAIQLAGLGAHLVLACRDVARGEALASELKRGGGRDVHVVHLDASDQSSIRACARVCARDFGSLDVLVNNAGLAQGERRMSPDGIELTFATNVLGYWLLTEELLGVLQARNTARIVTVASLFAQAPDLDDLQFARRPYDGLQAYAQSKACNRMLTWALARRLVGLHVTGLTVNAYAPGFVAGTGLSRDLPAAVREQYRHRVGRTHAEGADTAVWLAASPDLDGVSGRFFMDRREIRCELRDDAREDRLWRICGELCDAGRLSPA
jgi:NAD(P)-dependent dehydrogenase (short-subunit alcohol dehydrogenase family)